MKKSSLIFFAIFLIAAGIRTLNLTQPVDTPSWREADLASISRNYEREGMNLFYPRIDWRGTGPGFTEIEFPLYSWAGAVLHKTFGYSELNLRVLSFLLSLFTLWIFMRMAWWLLPQRGAIIASIFYALSPLSVFISTVIQAEPVMVAAYLTAVYAFLRWHEEGLTKYYWLAVAATTLTILTKATAAHIGVLFAALVLTRYGLSCLRQWRIWLFAVVSLLIPAWWYWHSHQLWLRYGNSMGLSNEYHWIGLDLLLPPEFILRVIALELFYVWMPAGVVMLALALWLTWRERVTQIALWWLVAVAAFYVLAARTSGDRWAFYYHIFAVPPIALLMGAGTNAVWNLTANAQWLRRSQLIAGTFTLLMIGIIAARFSELYAGFNEKRLIVASVIFGMAAVVLLMLFYRIRNLTGAPTHRVHALVIAAATICLVLTGCFQVQRITEVTVHDTVLYDCARVMKLQVPPGSLILASGGICQDNTGRNVAYNASYFFYWFDSKGFNICEEEQSLEKIQSFAAQGVKFFIAEKDRLHRKEGLEQQLRARYRVAGECDAAILFQLSK